MRTKYIPAIVMLFAGAVVSVICIVEEYNVLNSLKLLLGVLICFYIFGLIVKKVIETIIAEPPEEAVEAEEEEEGTNTESEEQQSSDEKEKKDEQKI